MYLLHLLLVFLFWGGGGGADGFKEGCNYAISGCAVYLPAVIKVVTTNRYLRSMSPLEGRLKKPSPSGMQYS